jgi:drug/metabolite transporter (DMT)-like permease
MLATRQQLLAAAVVLTALYPVVPVLLGLTVLRERVTWTQTAGLGVAGAAVGLIALAG